MTYLLVSFETEFARARLKLLQELGLAPKNDNKMTSFLENSTLRAAGAKFFLGKAQIAKNNENLTEGEGWAQKSVGTCARRRSIQHVKIIADDVQNEMRHRASGASDILLCDTARTRHQWCDLLP